VTPAADTHATRRRRSGRPAALALALGLAVAGPLVGACTGDEGTADPAAVDDGPNSIPVPSIVGGVELAPVAPTAAFVGEGIGFGTALPSEVAAAQAFTEDPEVAAVDTRRVYSVLDGRQIGSALAITLDGAELFDEAALAVFVRALVGAMAEGDAVDLALGGRNTVTATGPAGTAVGFREGDLFSVVRGSVEADVRTVVERQLAAMAAGAAPQVEPFTPLVPTPAEAAFVEVPTVAFRPIPPSEVGPAPSAPSLAGAAPAVGRYGVVAGERRSTVWSFALDVGARPSAESVQADVEALVTARAGGATAAPVEVVDRIVVAADGETSVRAFRHHGLVVLVEGTDPDQLDAIVTAWISAL